VKSIIFFYPSKTIGGAERLFARVADSLSSSYNCYIIDYKDGVYKRLLPNFNSSNFLNYEDKAPNLKDCYLISYPPMMFDIIDYFRDTNYIKKILFWAVHPANFESLIPFHRLNSRYLKSISYKNIKTTIELLNKNSALAIMDGSVKDNFIELYNISSSFKNYLPIPIVTPKEQIEYKPFIKEPVKVCLLGRVSGEKTNSAIRVFKDLNSIKDTSIELDIIGNGDGLEQLKAIKLNSNIKVNYLGVVVDNLDEALKKYDLLFATGTSTLEGAKLKIPSILLDDSYTQIPKSYKYKWIYDTKDYVLGSYIPSKYNINNNLTMQDIIKAVTNNNTKEKIANRCYEYTIKNHSLDEVTKELISYLSSSTLNLVSLKNLPINSLYFTSQRWLLSKIKPKKIYY